MDNFKAEHFMHNQTAVFGTAEEECTTKRSCSNEAVYTHNVREQVRKCTCMPQCERICTKSQLLKPNDPDYITETQRRVGPPNPKTLSKVVLVPPIADLSYWKANNLTHHSAINEKSSFDTARSGYQITTCCGAGDCPKILDEDPLQYAVPIQSIETFQDDQKTDFKGYPFLKTDPNSPHILPKGMIKVYNEQPGQVNTACGYNPRQSFTSGLPANYAVGNCPQDPAFKDHNINVFTQTLQPDVYVRNEVNEAINSNLGISFQQQIQPTTKRIDPKTGALLYTEHDPRLGGYALETSYPDGKRVTEADIYDPRYSGYGTSYRAYTEDVTGQTRFYYDDVDAVRMPNYICRSNIDFTKYADSYGPIPAGDEYGNSQTSDIRALAQNTWLESNLTQRADIQESLMRKTNNQRWQQRVAPISTGGQRMAGNMGCR